MKPTDVTFWLISLKNTLSDAEARTEYIEALDYAIETCGQYGWFVRWALVGGKSVVVRRNFPETITKKEALHKQYEIWCRLKETAPGSMFDEYKLFYAPVKKNGEPNEDLVIYEVDIAQLDDRMEKMESAINKWCKKYDRTLIAVEDFPRFSPISHRWIWELRDVEADEVFYATQWAMDDGVQMARKLS